jgi:hypothetical protein
VLGLSLGDTRSVGATAAIIGAAMLVVAFSAEATDDPAAQAKAKPVEAMGIGFALAGTVLVSNADFAWWTVVATVAVLVGLAVLFGHTLCASRPKRKRRTRK